MKRFAAVIALATLLPLAGCATPYGYSPGAWANYDGDYDAGYDGYDRPITYYGQAEPGYGNGYYAQQPYYAPQAYGPPPGYGPSWYSTDYSGCGCGGY